MIDGVKYYNWRERATMGIQRSPKWYESRKGFFWYWCPGCDCVHEVATIKPNEKGACWQFNKNYEAATLYPSYHVQVDNVNKETGAVDGKRTLCHVFINNGQIQFLGDCAHKLAGQTVIIPDFPDFWWDNDEHSRITFDTTTELPET